MVGAFSHSEVLLSVLENEASFFYTPTLTEAPSGISYWLEGAEASFFQISPITGRINVKNAQGLDYEDRNIPDHALRFSIIASDGTATATQSVQLRVLNLLDQAGEAVFTLPATDDNNEPLRYQLTNNNIFNLDRSGHVVTLAKDISINKLNSSWAVPLQVYNAVGNVSVQNLSFYLGNDAVTDMVVWRNIGNYYLLNEDKKQVVQQLSAISQSGQKITSYSLVGNDASYFSIDGQNQLLLLSTADYENPGHGSHYKVKVVAYTNSGVTGQQQIDIDLRNTIGLDGEAVINKQYNENQQRGVIYTASANDAADVVYSIVDPENYLSIDKTTGQVSFKRPIDMRALGVAGQVDNTPFEAIDKIVVDDYSQLGNISVKDLTNKRLLVVNNDSGGLVNNIKQKISPSWENTAFTDVPHHLLYSVVVYAASQSTELTSRGTAYASQLLILSINSSPNEDVLNWSDGQQSDSQTLSLSYVDIANNPALRFGATNVAYDNPVWYSVNNNPNFAINIKTGQVSLKSGVALDTNQEYSFVVTAFSGKGGIPVSISKLVTLVAGVSVNQHNPSFVIPEESMVQRPVVDFSFNNAGAVTTLELVDGSPDKNYFQISGTQLQFVSSIDYENRGGHAATYTAVVKFNQSNLGENLSLVQSYIVTLVNIDDNPIGFSKKIETVSLVDNGTAGLSIADFDALDLDGQLVSYSLAGPDATNFVINQSGTIQLANSLDGDARPVYSLVVKANSYGGNVMGGAAATEVTQLLTVRVNNDNNANNVTKQVSEGETFIGSFTNMVGIDAASVDNAEFQIVGNALRFTQAKDYETEARHNYTAVVLTNNGGILGSRQVIIQNRNINDSDVGFHQASAGVAMTENNVVGVALASFVASDADGQMVSYSLSGNDATYFTIDSTSGVVRLVSVLDYEASNHASPFYSVVVNANSYGSGYGNWNNTGSANNSISSLFILSLQNTDEFAPRFVDTALRLITTYENNVTNMPLVQLSAFDADFQNINYSLIGNNAKYFSINSNGLLLLVSRMDSEEFSQLHDLSYSSSYTVTVQAASSSVGMVDGGTNSIINVTTNFVLNVLNLDDFTQWKGGQLTGLSLNENNTAGLIVSTFTAFDPDGWQGIFTDDPNAITYDISGVDRNYFTINANTGVLQIAQSLDYDSGHAPYYSIVITAREIDGGGRTTSNFILSLVNLDDNDPEFISPATYYFAGTPFFAVSAVETNRINQVVTTLTASDADGQSISYDLVTGSNSNYFSINANTGELYFKSTLDYEYYVNNGISLNFSVKVMATSYGGYSFPGYGGALLPGTASISAVQNLNFKIINGNDNTPYFTQALGGISLNENNAVGVVLASFVASDADEQMVSYSLSGNDAAYFTIDSASGVVRLISVLDYESPTYGKFYSVVVNANSYGSGLGNWNNTGSASDSISSLFILSLGNVNEHPLIITNLNPFVDKDRTLNGFQIFSANDQDGSSVSYSLGDLFAGTGLHEDGYGRQYLQQRFNNFFLIDNRTGQMYGTLDLATNFVVDTVNGSYDGRYYNQYYEVRVTSKDGAGGGLDSSITATVPFYLYKSHDVGAGVSDTGGASSAIAIDVFNITSKDFVSIGGINDAATSQLYSLGIDGVKFSNSGFGVGDSYDNLSGNVPSNQRLLTTNLVNLQSLGADRFHNIKAYLFDNNQKDIIFVSTADLTNMVGADTPFHIYLDSYDKIYLLDTPPSASSPLAKVLPYLVNNNEIITGQNTTPTNSLTIIDDRYTDVYKISESGGNHYYQSVNGNIYGYDNRQDVLHLNGLHYLNAAGNQSVINNISALQSYVVNAGGAANNNGDGKVQLVESTLLDASNNVLNKQYAIKLGLVSGAANTAYDALIYLSNQDMSTGTNIDLTTTYSNYMAGGVVDNNNPNIHYHDLSFNDFLALLGGKDHFVFS